MAVSAQKAKAPIESVIVSPINESVTFSPNNTIIYRIGSDDLSYLLPQDSYFNMDVKFVFNSGTKPNKDLIIRAAPMFFDNVRVIHAGNEVYYSQYNIAQQFLDYVKTGSDLLDRDFCQYATHDTYKENGKSKSMSSPLIIKQDEWIPNKPSGATQHTCVKRGITMRLGQVIKIFSQCDMMPLKYLAQQVEFRFMLAKPEDFMCTITNNGNNFYPLKGNVDDKFIEEPEFTNFGLLTYTVEKSRFYMFGAAIDPGYDAVLSTENQTGAAKMWRYLQPRINLRNMPESSPGYYISNFQCITENTDKMFVWATRDTNYACTIRPKITNCNIRFGPYQIPKAPTAEDNWTKPALYKALVDDTLEYSTAYYTVTNKELANSYPVLPASRINGAGGNADVFEKTYHDTHIILAGSFTTDDDKLGSNSKAWNSQYNLHYNLELPEKPFIWVFAVDTEYVLTLKNGMLTSTNL